ncbi:MAG: anhydro-N-acetylmuramic acid kinase, partial [Ignavibacteria bacterium]
MSYTILRLSTNKEKTAIGLLSGTSIDGIDAVLLKIFGSGPGTSIKIVDFQTYKIPAKVKQAVLLNSEAKTSSVADICRLNVILGKLFADAVMNICRKNNISDIDFIGSHGQTIHHIPTKENYLGYKLKSTLQIGDPSIIANLTGITTVGDFRIADCAVGGDGAPLVPILDYILFRSKYLNRGLLNIGGIANITVIPQNCSKDEVVAFDTGPGNMIIDGLMKIFFRRSYDKDGKTAQKGKRNEKLFSFLLTDKMFRAHPPKSTGREQYGEKFQKQIIKASGKIPKENVIRTVTDFTAYTIYHNYEQFVEPKTSIDELIVSGGGGNNPIIMESLREYLPGVNIKL